MLQRRRRRLRGGGKARNPAHLGARARRRDERPPTAARDAGSGEGHRHPLGKRRGGGDRVHVLRDRDGLAGQRRLVELEPLCRDESRVRGDAIALAKDDEVARNERFGGSTHLLPVANDRGGRLDGAAQRKHGPLRARLLEESEHGVQDDDRRDRHRLQLLADRQRDGGSAQKERDEWVDELAEGDRDICGPLRRGKAIWTAVSKARLCIAATEATTEVGRELVGDVLGRKA